MTGIAKVEIAPRIFTDIQGVLRDLLHVRQNVSTRLSTRSKINTCKQANIPETVRGALSGKYVCGTLSGKYIYEISLCELVQVMFV